MNHIQTTAADTLRNVTHYFVCNMAGLVTIPPQFDIQSKRQA